MHALAEMRQIEPCAPVFVALTGSESEYEVFVRETVGWDVQLGWFPQNNRDEARGKGYLEGCLIQAALRAWSLSLGDGVIIKLTAKYVVENFNAVKLAVLANGAGLTAWRLRGGLTADTRCFGFRQSAFTGGIANYIECVDERRGYFIEHAIYDFAANNRISLPLLYCRPILRGLSGTSGQAFRTGMLKRTAIRATSIPAAWTARA